MLDQGQSLSHRPQPNAARLPDEVLGLLYLGVLAQKKVGCWNKAASWEACEAVCSQLTY